MASNLVQLEGTAPAVKNLAWLRSTDVREHFPFPGIRNAQDMILSAAERLVAEGKKFLIAEAPTGVGKSAIAMALGSWAKTLPTNNPMTQPGAYVLSPQKTLTAQYMKDFEQNGLVELKGKSNYWCVDQDTDCESAGIINQAQDEDGCSTCQNCPYKLAKKAFKETAIGVTNFAYYLNETVHAGQLKNRKMLILDEGHNAENQILGFADTVLTRNRNDEFGLGRIPVFKPGENAKCRQWIEEKLVPAATSLITELENQITMARIDGAPKENIMKLVRKYNGHKKFMTQMDRFRVSDDLNNWLCFTTEEDGKGGKEELYIKPLTATLFADEILFSKAEIVVIMSATILDFTTFMRNLGINPAEAICIGVPSDFPLENRPVFFKPQGSMAASIDKSTITATSRGMRYRDITMPKMCSMVEKICDKYVGKKGIIHTHSYEFTKQIVAHLMNTKHAGRLITHTSAPGSRDQAVIDHCDREDDTILISPSMTEGLDLREDLGRFCVVIKVPYPYIDPYVSARMKRDPDWYTYVTLLTIVQEFGRVVRSKTDKAHGYMLDSDFERLMRMGGRMLPKWWVDALIVR